MPQCLNIEDWRVATSEEAAAFYKARREKKGSRVNYLVIRTRLNQADVYAYLRARFGMPNGIMNFFRKDDSDNLVHWDFQLKAAEVDIHIQGRMRDVVIQVTERMKDEDWKSLILGFKSDFGRIGREKGQMLKSFEKFVVFQNKFSTLAHLCAELHESILGAPPLELPRIKSKRSIRHLQSTMEKIAKRSTNLYGDCLKLRLLTPIMAEAFLNMIVLTFCKPEVRDDPNLYEAFVREKIPQKLELLSVNCLGFGRAIDPSSSTYRDFMRVINARNFAIHGNVDPVREQIETVYFEGKRPLFTDNGDNIMKLFEHLELINKPENVVADYEAVHAFLIELQNMLTPQANDFFEHVISDPFPGYELRKRRVTKILPNHNAAMLFPGERWDDDLKVTW